MKREDNEFQKTCQLWCKEIKGCLQKDDDKRADFLQHKILESLKAWEDQQRTAALRIRMLRMLLAIVEVEKRSIMKTAKKRNRREPANDQQGNPDTTDQGSGRRS